MSRENKPKFIIVHHTGGSDANPLADTSHHTFEIVGDKLILAGWHEHLWHFKSRMGHYIGYHYFINKRGEVKQGRYENEEGAHCRGMNTSSIGICLAGNFDRPVGWSNHYPNKEQMETLKKLLLELTKKYNIPLKSIVPHRHFTFKSCYGKRLKNDWARGLIKEERPEEEKIISLYQRIIALIQAIIILQLKIRDKLAGIFGRDPYV